MLTQCTNPTAPFYHLDLMLLNLLESAGIDLPCGFLAAALALAIGALLFCAGLAGLALVNMAESTRCNRALNRRYKNLRWQ